MPTKWVQRFPEMSIETLVASIFRLCVAPRYCVWRLGPTQSQFVLCCCWFLPLFLLTVQPGSEGLFGASAGTAHSHKYTTVSHRGEPLSSWAVNQTASQFCKAIVFDIFWKSSFYGHPPINAVISGLARNFFFKIILKINLQEWYSRVISAKAMSSVLENTIPGAIIKYIT